MVIPVSKQTKVNIEMFVKLTFPLTFSLLRCNGWMTLKHSLNQLMNTREGVQCTVGRVTGGNQWN